MGHWPPIMSISNFFQIVSIGNLFLKSLTDWDYHIIQVYKTIHCMLVMTQVSTKCTTTVKVFCLNSATKYLD